MTDFETLLEQALAVSKAALSEETKKYNSIFNLWYAYYLRDLRAFITGVVKSENDK